MRPCAFPILTVSIRSLRQLLATAGQWGRNTLLSLFACNQTWQPGTYTLLSDAVMSSNGETTVVLRGVTHGAVDFLIKPVRIEELRNVWQHVVRRKRSVEVSASLSLHMPVQLVPRSGTLIGYL